MAAEPRTRSASGAPLSNGRPACAPATVLRNGEAVATGLEWLRKTMEQFEGSLVRYATRIIGDTDRGRDVVQETFLRLCREPAIAQSDHLAQWLFTVCRRLALDVRRKEMRMSTQLDGAAVCEVPARPAMASRMELGEEFGQVLRLLDALPANQQEVVRLKFQEGMSYKQIAEITGLSVSNVGYLLHTAVKALRESVKKWD